MWLLNRTCASRLAHLGSISLLCAILVLAPQALAGPAVRSATSPTTRSQPAAAPVVRVARPSLTISVVVAVPAEMARETASVILVGPDGQKQSFPVEGGLASIQYRRVVLRPGETVVINLPLAK
jgi:hypothetical protein